MAIIHQDLQNVYTVYVLTFLFSKEWLVHLIAFMFSAYQIADFFFKLNLLESS